MGLLDKAGASTEDKKPVAKPAPKEAAKAPEPAPAKQAKPAKAKAGKVGKVAKAKAPRAKPAGLGDDYELASNMNRRISWLVNFAINFGLLIAALFIASSDTGIITTILFGASFVIILLNTTVIPMKFSRNIGQFVSRTKCVRGDGSNPLFLHGIMANTTGLLSLVGLIFVGTEFQNLSEEDNTSAIIMFSLGALFMVLWFIDRFLRNGSEMGQGLYDLIFGAYLVKYVPSEDEKATGIWARLENMGNFGDQMLKRQEERKAKKEQQKLESAKEDDTTSQED